MSERILAAMVAKHIVWMHATFLSVIRDLTPSQLSNRAENTASPCIAWHFWHAARLADRVQAGLNDRTGLLDRSGVIANELWAREDLAVHWKLDPKRLGVFEIGSEMDGVYTTIVKEAGKEPLLEYAESAFSNLNSIIENSNDMEMLSPTVTVANFSFDRGVPGSMTVIPAADVRMIDELIFYEGHNSRHLGMVEALRGSLIGQGTATI